MLIKTGRARKRLGLVAQEPAQLGVVAGHRGSAVPLGTEFSPLQDVMEVGEQVGAENSGNKDVVAWSGGGHGRKSGRSGPGHKPGPGHKHSAG